MRQMGDGAAYPCLKLGLHVPRKLSVCHDVGGSVVDLGLIVWSRGCRRGGAAMWTVFDGCAWVVLAGSAGRVGLDGDDKGDGDGVGWCCGMLLVVMVMVVVDGRGNGGQGTMTSSEWALGQSARDVGCWLVVHCRCCSSFQPCRRRREGGARRPPETRRARVLGPGAGDWPPGAGSRLQSPTDPTTMTQAAWRPPPRPLVA